MTERERQILAMIRADPLTRQQAIAEHLGISRSAVAGHIMHLTAKGLIRGRGYLLSDAPFVAVVGGANVDVHGRPAARLVRGESCPGTVAMSPGGVARNIAENLARLGRDARLVTAVGNDDRGDYLVRMSRAAGVDTRGVLRVESAGTSSYVAVLDADGEPRVAVSDTAVLAHLDADRLRAHEAMLRAARVIVLDTNLEESALACLAREFAASTLFVDTVSAAKAPRIVPHLAAVHTLKASLAEAEAMAGISAPSEKRLPGLASWFHDRGVARVFITLGRHGVFFSTADGCGLEAAPRWRTEVENASGAGDAFVAGLVHAWLEDWPLHRALRFAMAAATLTLGEGAASGAALSLDAVERMCASNHED